MTQPEGREERRQAKIERRAAEAIEHEAKQKQREAESIARNALVASSRAEREAENTREEARLVEVAAQARRETDARDEKTRKRRAAAVEVQLAKEARARAISSETIQ